MYLIHELAAEQLHDTVKWLYGQSITLVHVDDIASIPAAATTLILHLALDHEIDKHKSISAALERQGAKQLNPHDLIAQIADDKYLFYNYMQSAEIPQPATEMVTRGSYSDDELNNIIFAFATKHSASGVVLKPVHGTEKIDFFMMPDTELLDLAVQHAQKLLSYDDLLLQNYIVTEHEYRVLYFADEYYSPTNLDSSLLPQLESFVKALPSKPHVIAFDILDQDGVLIPLEMNIRPAAIHRCINKLQ